MTGGPDGWADLASFLRAQRQLAKLSLRGLARLTNVSDSYLSQVERGLHQPSPEVLGAMARALGIPRATLYARVGWLDPGEEASAPLPAAGPEPGPARCTGPEAAVERAIADDDRLTPAQKAALALMYRTLTDGS